jgi:hypothetical protein
VEIEAVSLFSSPQTTSSSRVFGMATLFSTTPPIRPAREFIHGFPRRNKMHLIRLDVATMPSLFLFELKVGCMGQAQVLFTITSRGINQHVLISVVS